MVLIEEILKPDDLAVGKYSPSPSGSPPPPKDETSEFTRFEFKFPIADKVWKNYGRIGGNFVIGIEGKNSPGENLQMDFVSVEAPAEGTVVDFRRDDSGYDMILLRLRNGQFYGIGTWSRASRRASNPAPELHTLIGQTFYPGKEIVKYYGLDYTKGPVLPQVLFYLCMTPRTILIEWPSENEPEPYRVGELFVKHYYTIDNIPWTSDLKRPWIQGDGDPHHSRLGWYQSRPLRAALPTPEQLKDHKFYLINPWK